MTKNEGKVVEKISIKKIVVWTMEFIIISYTSFKLNPSRNSKANIYKRI